jgi:hypothetical protein
LGAWANRSNGGNGGNNSITNELISEEKVRSALGATDAKKQEAIEYFKINKFPKMFSVPDEYGTIAQEIRSICVQGSVCGNTFDLTVTSQNAYKFDTSTLHIRFYKGYIEFHWDMYNIRTDFFKHLWVDVIGSYWYSGGKVK